MPSKKQEWDGQICPWATQAVCLLPPVALNTRSPTFPRALHGGTGVYSAGSRKEAEWDPHSWTSGLHCLTLPVCPLQGQTGQAREQRPAWTWACGLCASPTPDVRCAWIPAYKLLPLSGRCPEGWGKWNVCVGFLRTHTDVRSGRPRAQSHHGAEGSFLPQPHQCSLPSAFLMMPAFWGDREPQCCPNLHFSNGQWC